MNEIIETENPRWDPYFLGDNNAFSPFWKEYLSDKDKSVLYIFGKGFDPRTCDCLKIILSSNRGTAKALMIDIDDGHQSPPAMLVEKALQNFLEIKKLTQATGTHLREIKLQMWSDDFLHPRRIGAQKASEIISDEKDLSGFNEIIVDISALPREVYFPLITKILTILDVSDKSSNKLPQSLHVVVSENTKLDQAIKEVIGDEDASYIFGFRAEMEQEANPVATKIWLPILGENQKPQLQKIYDLVKPDETCPILPSPALNPRRSDDILIEYHNLLFDEWRIDPRNIIYTAERNPFETYRQLYQTARRYDHVLRPLGNRPIGNCGIVMSAQSSKLLSIGTILAAYELKLKKYRVGIAQVEALSYEFDEAEVAKLNDGEKANYTMCLFGNFYEK